MYVCKLYIHVYMCIYVNFNFTYIGVLVFHVGVEDFGAIAVATVLDPTEKTHIVEFSFNIDSAAVFSPFAW